MSPLVSNMETPQRCLVICPPTCFTLLPPRLLIRNLLGRGAVCWVGLSAPTVGLSCVCCWQPSMSILLGAPHRGWALTQQDVMHTLNCFHPLEEKQKQIGNCAHLLTQERRTQLPKAVGTAPSGAPSFSHQWDNFLLCIFFWTD